MDREAVAYLVAYLDSMLRDQMMEASDLMLLGSPVSWTQNTSLSLRV